MQKRKIIYDITTVEKAKETLVGLTGISIDIFDYAHITQSLKNQYYFADKIRDEACKLGNYHFDTDLNNIDFLVQHITTSTSSCDGIRKKGLKNLYLTYQDKESELHQFLDDNEIYIDLENEKIKVHNKEYSIHYGEKNFGLSDLEENLWSIARKFYYDFCICGFFSIDSTRAYGGYVHKSPEILYNISELCKVDLRGKWSQSSSGYIVSFYASRDELVDTITNSEKESSDEEFLQSLVYRAVDSAYFSIDERIALLKDDVSIEPSRIKDISQFSAWD